MSTTSKNVCKTVVDVPNPPASVKVKCICRLVVEQKPKYILGAPLVKETTIAEVFSKKGNSPSQFEFDRDGVTGRGFFKRDGQLWLVEQVEASATVLPYDIEGISEVKVTAIDKPGNGDCYRYGISHIKKNTTIEKLFKNSKTPVKVKFQAAAPNYGIAYFKIGGIDFVAEQYIVPFHIKVTGIAKGPEEQLSLCTTPDIETPKPALGCSEAEAKYRVVAADGDGAILSCLNFKTKKSASTAVKQGLHSGLSMTIMQKKDGQWVNV